MIVDFKELYKQTFDQVRLSSVKIQEIIDKVKEIGVKKQKGN